MCHRHNTLLVSTYCQGLLRLTRALCGCSDRSNRILYSPLNKKELEMNALEDRLEKPKPVTEISGHEPGSEKRSA